MMGNYHVRFLGEGASVTSRPLPDTTILSGILGRALFRLDMGAVIGGRDGTLGSSANEIRRACQMAEVCHAVLVISEFEKAVGGLQSSNRTDGGEVARTIAWLL